MAESPAAGTRQTTMAGSVGRQIAYQWQRHVMRRRHMLADGLPHDMRFRFRTPDDVGRRMFKRRVHEPHILALLEALPPPHEPSLVLDVGANLGWYSVLLARLGGGRAGIFAFEPDPGNRELLMHNLALNGVENVEVVGCALSDRAGEAQLHRYRDINLGRHRLGEKPGGREPGPGSLAVPLQTLDGFVASRGLAGRPVQLLKIDVEGHEPQVVRGAAATLARVDLLLLEFTPMYYAAGSAAAMLDALRRKGLAPSLHDGDDWRATSVSELLRIESQVDTAWTRGSLLPG